LSKVIRNSDGFVAEKIVPADFDRPAVWENLAKQVEPEPVAENAGEAGSTIKPVHGENDHTGRQKSPAEPETPPSFDDDFSSPDGNVQAPDGSSAAAAPPEGAAQIDVDAIAEEYFNKGVQAGIERLDSDYKLSLKTLQSICEELDTVRETILKNSLGEMQELVLQIAEKIIRHSVTIQDETIVRTVQEAIQQAVKSDEFIISVNPGDYDAISSRSTDFINAVNGLENIVVRSDPSVDQGGCLGESGHGTVDGTMTSQLEIIGNAVKKS